MGASDLSISDVAKHCDTTPRAIRYYESLGFIDPRRKQGRNRRFSHHDAQVACLLHQAFRKQTSLVEIAGLLEAGRPDEAIALLEKRINGLERLRALIQSGSFAMPKSSPKI